MILLGQDMALDFLFLLRVARTCTCGACTPYARNSRRSYHFPFPVPIIIPKAAERLLGRAGIKRTLAWWSTSTFHHCQVLKAGGR
ncbi:hypothetical protein GGI35DRAFT_310226 [Trichoderma velutinum]